MGIPDSIPMRTALVAIPASIGFDTVFTRMQKQWKTNLLVLRVKDSFLGLEPQGFEQAEAGGLTKRWAGAANPVGFTWRL